MLHTDIHVCYTHDADICYTQTFVTVTHSYVEYCSFTAEAIYIIIPKYVCVCVSVCLCRFYLKTVNGNDLILFVT